MPVWPGLLWPMAAVLAAWALYTAAFMVRNRNRPERPADDGKARILLIVASAAFLCFAVVAALVVAWPGIGELDRRIAVWLKPWQEPATNAAFAWLTRFGNVETLIAVTVVTGSLLAANRRGHALTVFLTSVLGTHIFGWACKFIVGRERPADMLDVAVNSPAFPSLHAAGAVSVYVALAWVLSRDLQSPAARGQVAFWLTALALLIAWSRLSVGVHFASDVVAGLMLGAGWVCAGIAFGMRWDSRRRAAAGA